MSKECLVFTTIREPCCAHCRQILITHRHKVHDGPISCIAIHPTESTVAIGDVTGKITLWYRLEDDSSTTPTSVLHWHAHAVQGIAFAQDGNSIAYLAFCQMFFCQITRSTVILLRCNFVIWRRRSSFSDMATSD